MKRGPFFLILIATAFSANMHAADLPGLYPVESEFKDEVTGNIVRFKGAGTLLQDGNRFFILTASHVSQGDRVRIQIENKNAHILGRISDNRHDVEIIEIENPNIKPLASFDSNCGCYMATDQIRKWSDSGWLEAPLLVQSHNVMNFGDSQNSATYNKDSLLVPPWKSRPARANDARRIHFTDSDVLGDSIQTTTEGSELFVRAKIEPGLSGSPLFHLENKDSARYRLIGVAANFHRFERGTHLGSEKSFLELRRHYFETGKHGPIEDVSWHLRNGVTYRSLGVGTLEINPNRIESGSATTLESGGGTTSDGGFGAKSGDGSDLGGGMIWRGQSVQCFKLSDKAGKSTYILANLQADEFLSRHKNEYQSVETLKIGSSILPAFSARFHKAEDQDFVFGTDQRHDVNPNKPGSIATTIEARIEKKGKHIKIYLLSFGSIYMANPPRILFQETAVVELDEYGIPVGQKDRNFKPVVNVKALDSETIYQVDISGLFFKDVGIEKINETKRSPSIIVISSRTPAEYEFDFNREENLLPFPTLNPCLVSPERDFMKILADDVFKASAKIP